MPIQMMQITISVNSVIGSTMRSPEKRPRNVGFRAEWRSVAEWFTKASNG